MELTDQVVDGDLFAALDAAVQGVAFVGHQVRGVDVDKTLVHDRSARSLEVRLQGRTPLAGDE